MECMLHGLDEKKFKILLSFYCSLFCSFSEEECILLWSNVYSLVVLQSRTVLKLDSFSMPVMCI